LAPVKSSLRRAINMPVKEDLKAVEERDKTPRKRPTNKLSLPVEDGKPFYVLNTCAGMHRIVDLKNSEKDPGLLLEKNEIVDLMTIFDAQDIRSSRDLKHSIDKGYAKVIKEEDVDKVIDLIASRPKDLRERLNEAIGDLDADGANEGEGENVGIDDYEMQRDAEREVQKKNMFDEKLKKLEAKDKAGKNLVTS
jgi:hypothetical protein